MRIGVVAYEMEGRRTGVGRYLEGLLGGLGHEGGGHHWTLYFKGEPFDHPLWSKGGGAFEPVFDRRPRARPILWEQLRLPRILRRTVHDLLFSPGYSLPPASTPAVVTVHDLSFERLPEEFAPRERWRRRLLARRAARRAQRVLADTEAVARELEETYGLDRERIGVVPLGIEPKFRPEAAAGERELLRSLGVEPPYLLALGSILPRRRLDLVIAAFARIAAGRPDLRLVVAGANRLPRPGDLGRWIAASGVSGRIVERGYVPEEALAPLYRHAELSVYLSTYEGFGLPPLESLACGTPALVATGTALDELWPAYPLRLDRLDREEVTLRLDAALADRARLERLGAEAVARRAGLTWEHAAGRFLGEIERAAS